MTRYLLATDSVHTTAAACDYLAPRVGGDDAVVALAVVEGEARDAGDALNVVATRLPGTDIETRRGEGDPADVILAVAREADVDVVVMGAHAGDPDAEGIGSTARAVLAAADRPVVVVPHA